MGAMRFPKIGFMKRVFDLFKDVGIKGLEIDYEMTSPNALLRYNKVTVHRNDTRIETTPDLFNVTKEKGGMVPDSIVQTDNTGAALMDSVLGPFIAEFKGAVVNEDPEKVREAIKAAWNKVIKYDHLPMQGFLLERLPENLQSGGHGEAIVEWLESMGSGTGMYNHAFVESVMAAVDFGDTSAAMHAAPRDTDLKSTVGGQPTDAAPSHKWYCLDGGSDRLIMAMVEKLGGPSVVQKKKHVSEIRTLSSTKTKETLQPNDAKVMLVTVEGKIAPRKYSQVINTASLGCISAMDLSGANVSYAQSTAIRSLAYLASTKVAVKFKTRWWQDKTFMKGKPIIGGVTSTDLPVRMVVYPSYGTDVKDAPGVLIGSYNWSQDASRFGALSDDKSKNSLLLKIVLDNLAVIHDVDRKWLEEEVVDWFPHAWYSDKYTSGAFAQFGPGQFGQTDKQGFSLFANLQSPAAGGRSHFAGEATPIHHAWVLGALNSAWRAVHNAVMYDKELADKLVADWGLPDEYDLYRLRQASMLGGISSVQGVPKC
ncbi:hypothetical protein FRB94_013461 [Tulasnella sp. JGI-2019a]|nr:hypothetical protein FRB93_002309 [Tulasnella sp. JGI-2019a]KAG9008299.1 hypothetical protein FRB94_013461 [Tulasnella sp. JGI-2019a]